MSQGLLLFHLPPSHPPSAAPRRARHNLDEVDGSTLIDLSHPIFDTREESVNRVILHDQRLDGRVEAGLGKVVKVDQTTPLAKAFQSAIGAATSSDTELVVACHGFMTHYYGRSSNPDLKGGQGLELCKENLLVGNVSRVSALKGYFPRIWLMACGPAGTLVHKTRPFCREFAAYSNAVVIASDTVQLYHPGIKDPVALISRRVLRFGKWEGPVYEFHPDGRVKPFRKGTTPLP
jgi:hypothetical protein